MNVLPDILSIVSVTGGLLSALATLLSAYKARRSQLEKLHEAREKRFVAVLNSNNIGTLGSFIDEAIGSFTIKEYVSNPLVTKKVEMFLERLRRFVGTDVDVAQEVALIKAPPITEVEAGYKSGEFKVIVKQLRTGEIWNALARLRRYLELKMSRFAKSNGIPMSRVKSAGNLARVLLQHNLITQDAYEHLSYAITVCSKAIHGLDVTVSEAEEAVFHAGIGIRGVDGD